MSNLQFDSGRYLIRSLVRDDAFVGRNLSEDRSLNPKRVVLLPPGVQPEAVGSGFHDT